MARGGRNRMSTAEKQAKGTIRPSRERGDNVVEFPSGAFTPEQPDWFSDDAKAEWERLCPVFLTAGTLTEATITEFEDLCDMRGAVIADRRKSIAVTASVRAEIRKKLELFGVSRPTTGGAGRGGKRGNSFGRNGRPVDA